MKLIGNIKLDAWYKAIFFLGVITISSSFYFKVDFIKEKHVCGLGLGMILIGISYWMSEKYSHEFIRGGMLSTKVIVHSFTSILILLVGIAFVILFGFLLVKDLV